MGQVKHFYMSVKMGMSGSMSGRKRTCMYAREECVCLRMRVCAQVCLTVGCVMGSEQEQQGLLGPSVLQSLTSLVLDCFAQPG